MTESGLLGSGANKCHQRFIKCLDKNKAKPDGFSDQVRASSSV